MVKFLKSSFETAPDSSSTKQTALLLYDIAALTGGYSIDDPNAFAKRVTGMLEERIVASGGAESSDEGGVSDAEVVEASTAEDGDDDEAKEVEVVA